MNTETNTSTNSAASMRSLPIWIYFVAFGLLIGFLVLLYWGMSRSQQGSLVIGQAVPPFTVTTFSGETINTTDLSGKIIVVNFWASWCKPCEEEAAELEQAWRLYKSGGKVAFLGLAYVDTEPKSLEYLKKFDITYPNGPDLRTTVSQLFRTRGVPETFILDRDGRLAYKKIGPFASLAEIQSAIDSLLK